MIETVQASKIPTYKNANYDLNLNEKSRENLTVLNKVIDFKNTFCIERRARTFLENEPQALAFGAQEHALVMAIENQIINYDRVSL